MMSGRFAQVMETASIALILFGIVALCQPWSFGTYHLGFKLLLAGWVGLTIWSHRRALRPDVPEGNPQVTIDGRPPVEVSVTEAELAPRR
jgi:hypothetical protein